MAAAGCTKGRRFAAACGVLSRCVKAAESRPAATVVLPLMPGAEVSSVQDEHAPAAAAHAQMTIFYGGRVMVLEEVPADVASELLRVAAAAAGAAPRASGVAADRDLPMARKASLQRFMEKRKGRASARGAPYSRPGLDGDALTLAL